MQLNDSFYNSKQHNMTNVGYKIMTDLELDAFKQELTFLGNNQDIRDGFIHMSQNFQQVARIKSKFFANDNPCMLTVDLTPINRLVRVDLDTWLEKNRTK
jgi:uncharacterized protein (DUF952 family)